METPTHVFAPTLPISATDYTLQEALIHALLDVIDRAHWITWEGPHIEDRWYGQHLRAKVANAAGEPSPVSFGLHIEDDSVRLLAFGLRVGDGNWVEITDYADLATFQNELV